MQPGSLGAKRPTTGPRAIQTDAARILPSTGDDASTGGGPKAAPTSPTGGGPKAAPTSPTGGGPKAAPTSPTGGGPKAARTSPIRSAAGVVAPLGRLSSERFRPVHDARREEDHQLAARVRSAAS